MTIQRKTYKEDCHKIREPKGGTNMTLPLARVDKLIRKGNAHRVSEAAIRELAAHLGETAVDVARETITLANYAGKKSVKGKYIELAKSRILD